MSSRELCMGATVSTHYFANGPGCGSHLPGGCHGSPSPGKPGVWRSLLDVACYVCCSCEEYYLSVFTALTKKCPLLHLGVIVFLTFQVWSITWPFSKTHSAQINSSCCGISSRGNMNNFCLLVVLRAQVTREMFNLLATSRLVISSFFLHDSSSKGLVLLIVTAAVLCLSVGHVIL